MPTRFTPPRLVKASLTPIWLLFGAAACGESPSPATAPELAHSASANFTTASLSVVMSGLDAPRGLEFGPEGALYVVEAGEASYDPAACVPVYRMSNNCYSGTGAVSRLWQGKQERVVSGLPSFYNPENNDIGGPQDISFLGRGNAIVSIGWGGAPNARDAMAALVPAGRAFGTLVQLTPNGGTRHYADIAAFERNNAGGGLEDSNPYGVLVEPGQTFVADAGGNTIVRVQPNGSTSLVAVFPSTPVPPGPFPIPFYEAVPTEVKRGPDGALWVSTLSGAPFLPGAAAIWRIAPNAPPQKIIDGLSTVPDFDIAPDGTVWVSRYASGPFFSGPSALDRIAPNGARTTYLLGQISQPTGIAVGPDGAIYVSVNGAQANVGAVMRFVP